MYIHVYTYVVLNITALYFPQCGAGYINAKTHQFLFYVIWGTPTYGDNRVWVSLKMHPQIHWCITFFPVTATILGWHTLLSNAPVYHMASIDSNGSIRFPQYPTTIVYPH